MAAKALYQNPDGSTVEVDVIKQYPDGTADIGRGGEVQVEKCKIVKEHQPGTCILVEGKKASKAAKGTKTDDSKAKQILEAEAAVEQAKAALDADPENQELAIALQEANANLAELQVE
jgi:hypothetical protein